MTPLYVVIYDTHDGDIFCSAWTSLEAADAEVMRLGDQGGLIASVIRRELDSTNGLESQAEYDARIRANRRG
jgi:hypothetical protein